MVDFIRPHGKHIGIPIEMKVSLFRDVTALINRHKLYSISVGVQNEEYFEAMPEEARKDLISPYAFAFYCAVLTNKGVVKRSQSGLVRIAYLIDKGCAHRDHLEQAHTHAQILEKEHQEKHIGAIAFDSDDYVPVLQAADVISWAVRRKQAYGILSDEFEPLNEVIEPKRGSLSSFHEHIPIPKDGIEMFARPIRAWLQKRGRLPALEEFIYQATGNV